MYGGLGRCNPFFYSILVTVWPLRSARANIAASYSIGAMSCRSRARALRAVGLWRVVGVDEIGRTLTAAKISARTGQEAGEHWRRLTSRAVEPGQPVGPKTKHPIKPGGLRILAQSRIVEVIMPPTIGAASVSSIRTNPRFPQDRYKAGKYSEHGHQFWAQPVDSAFDRSVVNIRVSD